MSKDVRIAEKRLASVINSKASGPMVTEAVSALIDAKIDEKKIRFLKEAGTVILEYD